MARREDGSSPTETPSEAGFQLGRCRVDPSSGCILRGTESIHVEPKAMDVLVYLASRIGEVVSREELEREVWHGAVVGYDAVTNTIIKLRKALGDSSRAPGYIETVPKRGYRLIARGDTAAPIAIPPPTGPRRRGRRVGLPGRVAAGLVLAVAIAVLLARYWPHSPVGRASSRADNDPYVVEPDTAALPSIGVLPFEVLGDAPDQLYLARGLTTDLIADLSRLSGLSVVGVAASSVPSAGGGDRIGDARYQVRGGVQRTDDRITVEVRLVETATGRTLAIERYERPFQDLFLLQDAIGTWLAETLSVKVTAAEQQRLARLYTGSAAAYDLFLRAQASLLTRNKEENEAARGLYLRAIALDPGFARAYGGLALTYAADYRNQWASDGKMAAARALEMAQTAAEIDPGLPEVHWVLGYVTEQQGHHREALVHLDQALKLEPGYADALALKGGIKTYLGDPATTVKLLRRAIRRNPGAGYLYFMVLGRAYYFLDAPTQALINLREAAARNPASLEVHVYLAATLVRQGEDGDGDGDAEWEAQEIRTIKPGFSTAAWLDTYPMTDAAQRDQLREVLAKVGL